MPTCCTDFFVTGLSREGEKKTTGKDARLVTQTARMTISLRTHLNVPTRLQQTQTSPHLEGHTDPTFPSLPK